MTISLRSIRMVVALALLSACVSSEDGASDAGRSMPDDGGQPDASMRDDGGQPDSGPDQACGRDALVDARVFVYEVGRGELVAYEGTTDVSASLAGVVSELGSGELPADVANTFYGLTPDNTRWIRVRAGDGTEWVVISKEMPFGFGILPGSLVFVRYHYYFGGWDPMRIALEVRAGTDASGALTFAFARDSRPGALELPAELSAEREAAVCRVEHQCGDYARYALAATLGSESAVLDVGEQRAFGDFDVWHVGTQEQLDSSTSCADWFVADSTLALSRTVPISAAATGEPDCMVTSYSDVPGVRIEIDDSACAFTLAQAAAGLTFAYQVVVEQDVSSLTSIPLDAGGCQAAHTSGLYLGERIFGDDQSYCVCDVGLCPPSTSDATPLRAGTYPGSFEWHGRNWNGPSDTSNPEGDAFPAGTYSFEVRAAGEFESFAVRATLSFTLR